ncbi:hypothetical protein HMPREF1551_01802, partial [Capnocytophaga sp. oral taxon 863 str. F0517]|uniref:transposase n=1 Tax=Capnocytophaga sp. oral taxon 863 TaxID=1227265 RepID=UPI0003960734
SVGKRGFSSKYCFAKIIQLIFKRLKTGCQWREIPIKEQFEEGEISWNTITLISGVKTVAFSEYGSIF